MTWNIEDLRRLDRQYAEANVPRHVRPMRAAMDLLGSDFRMGVGGNPEVSRISRAYLEVFPDTRAGWPGMGTGLVASVDQVRRFVMPVMYGTYSIEPWQAFGFSSKEEWLHCCRDERDIAADTCFAFADLLDFSYGMDELKERRPQADTLWHMARDNLANVATALPTVFDVDAVIQPICLVVELSLKATLVFNGADPDSFRGRAGHDIARLSRRLSEETPHRDDPLVQTVVAGLPAYVESRYAPAGLTRLQVVRWALGAQFVAASTTRRLSGRDAAALFESMEWPGMRRPFFT